MTAIADYLEQLSQLLRRRGRRRILDEVRGHLLDAASADPAYVVDPERAARRAVERFGPPARVAAQFNALARRPRALLQRAAAAVLACAGMATVGTATVWALEPGAAHAHRQASPQALVHRHRARP